MSSRFNYICCIWRLFCSRQVLIIIDTFCWCLNLIALGVCRFSIASLDFHFEFCFIGPIYLFANSFTFWRAWERWEYDDSAFIIIIIEYDYCRIGKSTVTGVIINSLGDGHRRVISTSDQHLSIRSTLLYYIFPLSHLVSCADTAVHLIIITIIRESARKWQQHGDPSVSLTYSWDREEVVVWMPFLPPFALSISFILQAALVNCKFVSIRHCEWHLCMQL